MSDKREGILSEDDEIQQQQRKREVASLRNKVYIFFLGLFLFIFWPTFLSPIETVRGTEAFSLSVMDPINGFFHNRGEGGLLEEIEALDVKIDELTTEIERVVIQQQVIENLEDEEKQNTIINCLNFGLCSDISEGLLGQLGLLRIFIIVGNLTAGKFDFNQQHLLRNINEFMVESGRLGEIRSIRFGDPVVAHKNHELYKLPIDISLSFGSNTKENLLAILNNIETKIFGGHNVMYVIESMNYSIPEYNQPQTISLGLNAYYFVGGEAPIDD